MNQWSSYKIITISQPYKVITSCKTAINIPPTIIQMKRNNIQIQASKESTNELDIT